MGVQEHIAVVLFVIQWENEKPQFYWISCLPCLLCKITSGLEHFLLAFFLLSIPGQSSLFPMEDGFLDDGRGDQPLHSGLGSPHCFAHQNGERVERYSRKVFVGGLPPDIDEGIFRKKHPEPSAQAVAHSRKLIVRGHSYDNNNLTWLQVFWFDCAVLFSYLPIAAHTISSQRKGVGQDFRNQQKQMIRRKEKEQTSRKTQGFCWGKT